MMFVKRSGCHVFIVGIYDVVVFLMRAVPTHMLTIMIDGV